MNVAPGVIVKEGTRLKRGPKQVKSILVYVANMLHTSLCMQY